MRKIVLSISTIAAVAAFSAGAEARTFKRDVTEQNDTCYTVQYVPSTYLYNTRGKKVYGESTSWEGDLAPGAKIVQRRNPAVYIQTRELLEQDHYSLVKGC